MIAQDALLSPGILAQINVYVLKVHLEKDNSCIEIGFCFLP